ncbi:unnamed protein product [Amoebophrya sp. A25]|nr:unnamed protein product [Amoebophrya sp. A25]|eukprot:GSA25T00001577001.1
MRMYALQAESFFGVFTTEDGAKAVKKLKELVFDQLNRNKLFEGGFLAAIKKNLTRMFNAVRNHSIRNNLVIFRINGEPTTLLVRELRKVRFFVPLEGEIVVITEEPAKDEPVAPIADPAPPASDEGLAGWQIALIVVLPTLAVVAAAIGIYFYCKSKKHAKGAAAQDKAADAAAAQDNFWSSDSDEEGLLQDDEVI